MFCKFCGNETDTESDFCPKCGKSLKETESVTPENNKVNLFAILSIVLIGISYFLALWGTVAIAGIVLAVIALVKIPQTREKGKGLAIASIILGAISLLYTFFVVVGLGL